MEVGSLEMLPSGGVWKVPGAALGCPTQNDHCLDGLGPQMGPLGWPLVEWVWGSPNPQSVEVWDVE